jgi:histidinol-phosphatase (PHP family)
MFDYHIHPYHSADGLMSLREMALAAIGKGLTEICSTAHFDIDFPSPTLNFECDLIDYVEDVERYAMRFAHAIAIKTGLEVGMQAGRQSVYDRTRQALSGLRFDYFIGSIHWLGREGGEPREAGVNPVWGYGATRQQVLKRYAGALLQCAHEFPELDCIGHLTYYSRQDPHEDHRMWYTDAPEELDALFVHLAQNGKGLEINTSTKENRGYFMPDLDMVKRYRELGGEIVTIGSDAHRPHRIGAHYNEACTMLLAAGIEHVCTYADHKPTFHRIG